MLKQIKPQLKALWLAIFATLVFVTPAFAARTDVTVNSAALIYGTISADAADLTFTACDVSNLNSCTIDGKTALIFTNTGASTYTVTINSVADELGRTGDITAYSLAAGETCVFGPFPLKGWGQSGTPIKLHFEASNAAVKVAPVRFRF